ncbi:hypothetical protein Ea357_010 [Erwinia phage Ea35-70]|uniref:Virion structural protein n=9 Tax=Agricanvirus TaxID=1984776 RepID=W6ASZ1_9CAUD|nr:hypothetical protein Ea357_010 [Erwinia phage Ea35-70]YP_009605153.1 putative virion structural protein [Erwinia phage vB_EamM_Deimos-Minion]YP_009605795.1 putative virion structural protein [Erwinia phage vB_EamM_Simmy50]YP_009606116.1 putative virion structural protein [Erwinia phage vB_EamM_Special G]YP_009621751.1 putative virion structural protein [Erwinia phage vB_EamM_Desertfox]AUG85798.1 putative virion structural protein [Erwinia phage vB_EamM_Bosolaphorus]AUG86438.1 putative viri
MKRNVRSHAGNMLQVAQMLGIAHVVQEHTTLNEKFNVLPDQIPQTGRPNMQYFCIGFGGHKGILGKNNTFLSTSIDHYPDHAALYKHIPFVLREIGNDLTADQRAKYRLRSIITLDDGSRYIAYYLKKIELSNVVVRSQKNTRDEAGLITTSDYVPDASVLNPQQPELNTNNIDQVVTSTTFLSANAELDLSLNELDCSELLDVARILYKDEAYALVSEYGLVAGIDVPAQGSTGAGGTIQYTEVVAAQIVDFMTNRGSGADDDDKGITCLVNYGATEPLLADSGANATTV